MHDRTPRPEDLDPIERASVDDLVAATAGLVVGFVAVVLVWLPSLAPVDEWLRATVPALGDPYKKIALAWPWYAPVGAGTTVLVALALAALGRTNGPPADRSPEPGQPPAR